MIISVSYVIIVRKDFHQKMKQEGKSIEQLLMCMFDLFRLLVRVKYMLKTFFL